MPHAWEDRKDVELNASPEQVWEAVATGPGMDSWYMGHSQVEPGVGGTVRTAIGAGAMESTVTHWEPPHRFAYRGHASEDGRFHRLRVPNRGTDRRHYRPAAGRQRVPAGR